jgi:hypothetical protein
LVIDAVDDVDDCFDIALWSAAAAAPMSRIVARGKRGSFMADLLGEPPLMKNSRMQTKFR